jgi:hypothetical protein
MAAFRCRKHRQAIQKPWQVSKDTDGGRAARPLEGSFRDDGLAPGGWVRETRRLADGLYCQACLAEGDAKSLPDYDAEDLRDAGLLDVPHVGMTADDFDLVDVWRHIKKSYAQPHTR